MLLPFEWLKEFIEINETSEEVAHLLTMAGNEVESIEGVDDGEIFELKIPQSRPDDVVFEVNITPNRSDCLSVIGVARELSAITKRPLNTPIASMIKESFNSDFKIEILDVELCNRYTGRIIKDVKVGESPEWMMKRLKAAGIRSINSIVDITNYVLLEFGHPMHAFDLSKLKGNTIRVKVAGDGQKIITLDGIERNLPDDALLIWDGERPVAVAGIMGGLDTEVTEKTVNIFLESAYFNPSSIRKSSKLINLKSESSYRFERGTDILGIETALNRASQLIIDICGGKPSQTIDVYPKRYITNEIALSNEKVNKVLGAKISEDVIEDIFTRLNFQANKQEKGFIIIPPSYRRDVEIEEDLIEEIARIYGYDRIPSKMPEITPSAKIDRKTNFNLNSIRDTMRIYGFTETINYSFMSEDDFSLLNIHDDDIRRDAVFLKNPLKKEQSLMRTFLLPTLIDNMVHNLNFGISDINLYEIANIFFKTEDILPNERLKLCAISFNEKKPELYKDPSHPFFSIKGIIEGINENLRIYDYSFVPSKEPFLIKEQSSDIYVNLKNESGEIDNIILGFMGILSPDIIMNIPIKIGKPVIAVFEIFLDTLFNAESEPLKFKSIPKYPSIERDLALIVDDGLSSKEIVDLIKSYPDDLIESVSVFDFYKGKNISVGKKSLAFHITYRSKEKTLTDDVIDSLHKKIVYRVIKETTGNLRE